MELHEGDLAPEVVSDDQASDIFFHSAARTTALQCIRVWRVVGWASAKSNRLAQAIIRIEAVSKVPGQGTIELLKTLD
jgi:hypothetical protein